MSLFRERQALGWAKVDDAAAAKQKSDQATAPSVTEKLVEGVESLKLSAGAAAAVASSNGASSQAKQPSSVPASLGLPKAPQAALMGVSFLGNLDAISNCGFPL